MRRVHLWILGLVGFSCLANADYSEQRRLALGTDGVETLSVVAGAGDLRIVGISGLSEVTATATIRVLRASDKKARKTIKKRMVLDVGRDGSVATLNAYFKQRNFSIRQWLSIDLQIEVPQYLNLTIADGGGAISMESVHGDVVVSDSMGPIALADVGGSVSIIDGTGEIRVARVGGDVDIKDGTGAINVRQVDGGVTIADGVGHIDIASVGGDLRVTEAGKGGFSYSDIAGRVFQDP